MNNQLVKNGTADSKAFCQEIKKSSASEDTMYVFLQLSDSKYLFDREAKPGAEETW